jgi:hypothetical protein
MSSSHATPRFAVWEAATALKEFPPCAAHHQLIALVLMLSNVGFSDWDCTGWPSLHHS